MRTEEQVAAVGITPEAGRAEGFAPCLIVKEVAAIIRVSRPQVYALISEGVLPAVRLPGCTRLLVTPEDLRAYLDAGRSEAAVARGEKVRRARREAVAGVVAADRGVVAAKG